eukprot:1564256-Amphidinium_carterae.1
MLWWVGLGDRAVPVFEDPMMLMDDVGCAAAPYDIEYVDPAGLQEGTAPTLYRGATDSPQKNF